MLAWGAYSKRIYNTAPCSATNTPTLSKDSQIGKRQQKPQTRFPKVGVLKHNCSARSRSGVIQKSIHEQFEVDVVDLNKNFMAVRSNFADLNFSFPGSTRPEVGLCRLQLSNRKNLEKKQSTRLIKNSSGMKTAEACVSWDRIRLQHSTRRHQQLACPSRNLWP